MSEIVKLQINQEYFDLVPRPEPEQFKSLRNSILEDGQQVDIIANPQGVILDGHTRYVICKELEIEPKYKIKEFETIEKEKLFVISANLNRRQLTLFERGEILFDWWKEEKKRSKVEGGFAGGRARKSGVSEGAISTGKKERLLQRFAKIIGSSASVCHQLTWLLLHAPEDFKVKLRCEEITIAAAYTFLKKPDRKTVADYKKEGHVYLRYPICLNCKNRTVSAKGGKCHVHRLMCCKKCGWGI